MEVLCLASAFFVPASLDFSSKPRAAWAAIAAVLVVVATVGVLVARDAWWDGEDVPLLETAIASSHGYEGTDEYAPDGSDHYELAGALPDSDSTLDPYAAIAAVVPNPRIALFDPQTGKSGPPAGVRVHTQRWTAETKNFEAETPKPVVLGLRVLDYPAWEVRVDGQSVQPGAAATTAQMLVPLEGGEHRVEVRFRRTSDRVAGDAISCVSVIALLGVGIFLYRRARGFEKFEPVLQGRGDGKPVAG
jgi:hypothetical protein